MSANIYKCGYTAEIAKCKKNIPKKEEGSYEIIINREMDSGANGIIYFVEIDGIQKILKITKAVHKDIFFSELCHQHIVSLVNIAPKIYDYWVCGDEDKRFVNEENGHGVIIMDYAGNMTLNSFIDEKSQIQINNKKDLINSLQIYIALFCLYVYICLLNYKLEMFHLDLHLKNIMVLTSNEGELLDIKFIDFGNSRDYEFNKELLDNSIREKSDSKFIYIGQYFNTLMADTLMVMDFFKDRYVSKKDSGFDFQTNIISNIVFKFFVEKTIYNKIISPTTNPFWVLYDEDDYDIIEEDYGTTLYDIIDELKRQFPDIITDDNEDSIIKNIKFPSNIRKTIKSLLKIKL